MCKFNDKNLTEFRFSKEDMKAEVITFTATTLDGAAAFISPFTDNMLQHPEICGLLIAEIDAADNDGKLSHPVVTYEETTKLPFLMACVKETLRRDAPAQTIIPRVVSSPGYQLTPNIFIPASASMGASPYIIHRHVPTFSPSPELFQPSRWIPGEGIPWATPKFTQNMERLGVWWDYGDRECAGKSYAQMQSQKLLVELFRRFNISGAPPGVERFKHERWAVGMFWEQRLLFQERIPN